ncbi:thioredoxin family protein [Rivibacter subsaxonicus]|uniref:Protein disulfide-isomerase n=1 Tax=Rivibacter subsaxonicus TaxID=457575 RepID=A0A4Q7W0T0_9BURK|nr:thioredoxin family protein [Rivibacter subsaxonicus]RZU02832.1 protein disulfide-isomerase [Rivibacter subsaxonicus]
MKSLLAAFAFLLAATAAVAAEGPYNEAADARAEIRQALSQAADARVPVLLVFGANWCGDCKVLDLAMKGGSSAPLITREFRVVKIDVGRFDRNLDVATSYGVPLKKGIPAVVVLSPANQVLYATRAGELADARSMGEAGILEFFRRVSSDARPGS